MGLSVVIMFDKPEATLRPLPGVFKIEVGRSGLSLGSGTVDPEGLGGPLGAVPGTSFAAAPASVRLVSGVELDVEPLSTLRTHTPGVFLTLSFLSPLVSLSRL